ncbi:hypothetical protein [Catellatospora vulcania]|uniref:hypothetical protein n=1 Tax=Catellatospora vulcania TaxID=1460450 RepID=UPI0012D39598|nr:hypothetical protein [Catellatospora vulcania]
MTEPNPTRLSFPRETLALLRVCWGRLLAIAVAAELFSLLLGGGLLLAVYSGADGGFDGVDEPVRLAAVYAVPGVLTAVSHAWAWAAASEVFRGVGEGRRVGFGEALRRGLRHCGRLALWLAAVALLSAAGSAYSVHVLLDGYATAEFEAITTVVTVGGWYLSFATALLPLVVLLERRGPGRAWWLAHSRAATIGQIVAVLAFGWATSRLADVGLTRMYVAGPGYAWWAAVAVETVVGIVTSIVTMAALTVVYLRRMSPAVPSAPDPATGGSEPVVIELGRTW